MAESKFKDIFPPKKTDKPTQGKDTPSPKRGPGRPRGKRTNPDYSQVTAYIPKKLHTQVKIKLLEDDGREFSELVEDLLKGWLAKAEP